MTGKRIVTPSSSGKTKKQKVLPTFKDPDVHQYCLMKICSSLIAPLFRQLLRWFHPKWKCDSESFEDYLEQVNMTNKDFKVFIKNMHNSLRQDMVKDPKGKTWDITLMYYAIKDTNSCLASKKDQDAWTKKSDEVEYFITKLKNERNKVAHLRDDLDTYKYRDWCKEIHIDLEGLLSRIRHRCPHVPQKEIDEKIDEVRSFINEIMNSPVKGSGFDPSKYEEYKKEMEKHEQFVTTEGKDELKERHNNRNCLEVSSYLSLKKALPVEEVFVDMVLEEGVSGKQASVEVKDLFEESDSLYYLEGRAGVGKTSLIKYITMVWTKEKGEVEGLEDYDLLFHLAGRDHHISSFDQLLSHSMPTTFKKMSIHTLHAIIYGLRSIVIFDGYDEKNEESARTLKDVLSLKKDFKFTLLVTSRPEATDQFRDLANSHGIRIKHIKVLGIPESKRTEFLQKYSRSMGNNDDITPLLRYLKRTEHRLSGLWKLPYNLSILAILWMNKPSVIDSITTSSELHWQMHQTYTSKLKQRLLNYDGSKHLPPSVLDRKVEEFMYILCEISLTTLAKDDIILSSILYKRLVDKCKHLEIPTEEMVGAYLSPSQSETDKIYCYPHKGVIEFLAALFIYMKLGSIYNDIDQIQKRVMNELIFSNAPEEICQQIKVVFDNYKMQSSSSEARGPLALEGRRFRKILDEIPGGVSEKELPKFQNMIICFIGILYVEEKGGSFYDEAKQEAVSLLRDTGVKDRDQWLSLLNDVKCDESVVTFISLQTDILEGEIKINDGNLFAYNSLFRATKSREHYLQVVIKVMESIADVGDFLSQINELKFQVRALTVTENNIEEYANILRNIKGNFVNQDMVIVKIRMYKERKPMLNIWKELKINSLQVRKLDLECDFRSSPTASANFSDEDVIREILLSCEKYVGVWSTSFKIHGDMKKLRVRLSCDATFDHFIGSLTTAAMLGDLDISFNADFVPLPTKEIPGWVQMVRVYIPKVRTKKEAGKVVNILRSFGRSFFSIFFPHCRLSGNSIKSLLDALRQVRVKFVIFPKSLYTNDLKAEILSMTGNTPCIIWLSSENMWNIETRAMLLRARHAREAEKGKIANMLSELEIREVEIKNLKLEQETRKTEIENLKLERETRKTEIENLKLELETQKTEIERLEREISPFGIPKQSHGMQDHDRDK